MAVQSRTITKRKKKAATEAKEQAITTAGTELSAKRAAQTPGEKASETIAQRKKLRAEAPDPALIGKTFARQTPNTAAQTAELRRQEANRAAGRGSFSDTAEDLEELNLQRGIMTDEMAQKLIEQRPGQEGAEGAEEDGGILQSLGFEKEEGKGVLGGDIATPENLLKAAILGLGIGSLAIGGIGLAGKGIQLGGKFGLRLIATRGLSSKAVSTSASGLLPSQQIALHRAGAAVLNTKNAARTMGLLNKITAGSKYASYVVGALSTVAGLTAWGEWGRSEGLESMSFTYRKAKDSGNEQLADEITQVVEEATDKETIDYIIRVVPFANVVAGTRLKNIGSDFARTQSDYEDQQRKLEKP